MKTNMPIDTEQKDHSLIDTYVGPMYLNVAESNAMRKRARGVYEKNKTHMLEKALKPGMTFLDIGANKGWFSCLGSKLVGPEGKVVCYEPIPTNYYWLNLTMDACPSRKNVDVKEYALGDCAGHTYFNIAARSGGHTFQHRPTWDRGQLKVRIEILDEMWEDKVDEIDVIKIDVEASEERVLAGMSNILRSAKKLALFIDVHVSMGVRMPDVILTLRKYGFKMYTEAMKPIATRPKGYGHLIALKGKWEGLR